MLWSTDLTKDEVAVLLAFADHNPIVYPVDCGLSKQQIADTIKSLRKKNIVKDSKVPLCLTKKGLRYLKSITSSKDNYLTT
jgi:predicted transcriptional regulator